MENKKQELPEDDVRRDALVEWLCVEYPREEAELYIREAKIWEEGSIITIQYSNGAKDIVEFTDAGIVHIS